MASLPTPVPVRPAETERRPRSSSRLAPRPDLADSQEVEVDPTVTSSWRTSRTSPSAPPSLTREAVRGPGFQEKYALDREIGRGGMGRVVIAYDRDLKRQVAMKILDTTEETAELLHRFVEEAQISGQLEHPNVLPVHDVGMTDGGDYFFTMKLVRSHTTLRAVIDDLRAGDAETHERFSYDRRIDVIRQLCGALQYAHDRGVVHRDVKPENVMLDEVGGIYLLDWGIARLRRELEERAKARALPDEAHDGAGTSYLIGTPAYMAPEQALGESLDGRTDVYALTAVLYELLCLHHYLEDRPGLRGALPSATPGPTVDPRACDTAPSKPAPRVRQTDIIRAVLEHAPRDAESYYDRQNGRTPRVLSRICRRGLAKDPHERLQSARELADALERWQTGCGPVVCPGTALQRGMSGYVRWIDRHPLLVPVLSYGGIGLFLASYLVLVWRQLGG